MASTTSYSVNITNDGNQNYSIAVLRNPGTVASGGTALTIPHVESNFSNPTTTTTKLLGVAFQAALRAAANDLSTNG